jgi:mannosidase alpha-like ER degradation enhancer 1
MRNLPQNYEGVALTLIDSLSTLAVIGDKREFQKAVFWIKNNLSFDLDARFAIPIFLKIICIFLDKFY